MLAGEMPFEIATSGECLWTERAAVSSGQPTKEPMEVKVSKCGGSEWTIFTVEKGKVAVTHPDAVVCFEWSPDPV